MLKYIGDFEKLIEFGFEYYKEQHLNDDYSFYTEECYRFNDGTNTCEIVIKRENSNWVHLNKEREIYIHESDWEMGVSMGMYDLIFDLIQAGLVEKMEK